MKGLLYQWGIAGGRGSALACLIIGINTGPDFMHGSGSRHLVYRLQIGLFGVKLDQAGYGSSKNMSGMAGIGLHLADFFKQYFPASVKVAAAEHTLQVLLEKYILV